MIDLALKIYVAGHQGLVGSAIVRRLKQFGYKNIVTRNFRELDLRIQQDVQDFFSYERPDYIFLAAAKVGGIQSNFQYPADFIYDNLVIQTNVIHASYKYGVKKLLFLGSSCIYPRVCFQPIKEECLLAGPLEETNKAYAIAKIAGITMCQSYNRQHGTRFISCMPTNLYGPGDNFDLVHSHVLPALLRKFYEAKKSGKKEVVVWGSGTPRREFLYVNDLADALVFLMNHYEGSEIINIGTGEDVTISELARQIKEVVGFKGKIVFDKSKPDGTTRKLLDVSRIKKLGWKSSITLENGIRRTFDWYISNCRDVRLQQTESSLKQEKEREKSCM